MIAIVRGSVSLRTHSVTVAPRGSVVLTERSGWAADPRRTSVRARQM